MGFTNDKTELINNVALFETLNTLPKSRVTSSLASVNSNSKNLLSFLIDLLAVTCKDNAKNPRDLAKCEATRILIEILVEFYPKLMLILKQGIIKAIKAGLSCGSDFTVPNTNFKIAMKISNLDFNGMTKIDPFSPVGSTFFGPSPQKDFNFFINNLVKNGGGTTWKNIVDLHYNKTTEEIQFKLNNSVSNSNSSTGVNGGVKFDEFLNSYTDSIDIMSKEVFLGKITNKLTGALTSQLNNTSLDKIISNEKVSALEDKILNSDPCKEDYQYEDNFFVFSNEELGAIEDIANQKYLGITKLDLGCGTVPSTVDGDVMKSIYDEIQNSSPSQTKAVMEKSINTLNDQLTRNVGQQDKNVAKLSLSKKMIEEIPKILTDVIMEPKIVLLYQISSKMVNGPLAPESPLGTPSLNPTITKPNIDVNNNFDFAKATTVFFEYVARESLAALLEVLFLQIKKEIVRLIQNTVRRIIKEKLKIRKKAIESVVTGFASGLISTGADAIVSTVKQL